MHWMAHCAIGFAHFYAGRFESALPHAARMHRLAADIPVANMWLGIFLLYAGRTEEATAVFAQEAAAGTDFVSLTNSVLGAMVRRDATTLRAALAEREFEEAIRADKEFSWMAAALFANIGDADEALQWLSRAIEMGFINRRFFAEHDPFLARLRGEPRFEALMERAGARQREIEE